MKDSVEVNIYRNLWYFFLILKKSDPIIRRRILRLKFSNLSLKFQIFRLQCSHIITDLRLRRLEFTSERRHGARFLESLLFACRRVH